VSLQKIRCFIAVDIDDPVIVDRIVSIQYRLSGTGVRMKLVEKNNLHITLRFLGEISRPLLEKVIDIIKTVSFNSFQIKLQNIGCFPTPSRPRVIWIGVTEGEEKLREIHNELESKLRKLGFPKEKERFVAHLTIARVKSFSQVSRLIQVLNELRDIEIGEFTVNCIRVKKSTLTPKGPIYSTLYEQKATK